MSRVQSTYPWLPVLETAGEDEVVATSVDAARPAVTTPLPDDLHPALREALAGAGIDALWSHQADALESARRGHTIVTTGTASGKSLAFNLPVLDTLAGDLAARAFYLYPTKALAQDQARKLSELGGRFLRHAIYDGDTPREERRAIRQRSNLILTNPDMLHVGVLPNHRSWGDVLANLAWVVVDEAHVYRGVFGSHVANVLRRLRRLARAYGAEPRFVLTSATIANPRELAEGLTGLEMLLVDRDGAPHAERQIVMWNPPLVDEKLGKRASALSEAAKLLAGLVERDVRTICFLKSRRGVELIQRFARLRLEDTGRADLAERIAPYRAGYTPTQRREIERRLAEGELLAVVATNALELGIDVGELDAAMCVTFPGTVASLRQMWGRAGRRDTGLAMYVAGEDALDQFFCRHPDEFLERPVERAILDHESEEIHLAHLAAAAYELPLTPEDEDVFGPRWEQHAQRLVKQGRLRERGGRYLPRGAGLPGGRDRAALGLARLGGDRRGRGRRADRHRRVRARALGGAPGRGLPAHGAALRGRGPRPGRSAARSCGPSRATGTPSPRRSPRPGSSRCASAATCCGVDALVRDRVGDRAGRRLPEEARRGPLGARPAGARHARAGVRDPGALVRAARRAAARGVPARGAAGLAARGRARADRGAAADRDVRPLGHRRPLHRLPPPDRPRDDLHLRRPPRRRGDHARRATSASRRWSTTRCG